MPNLTTPIPPNLTGETENDLKKFKEWGTALIDELSYVLNNLDAGNVIEASSVKAENIDTSSARIENAQIGALTADKLTAGTVDTGKVSISGENGKLLLSEAQIIITDRYNTRFMVAYNSSTRKFNFCCVTAAEPRPCPSTAAATQSLRARSKAHRCILQQLSGRTAILTTQTRAECSLSLTRRE